MTYPLVEIITGLVFLGLFLKFQNIFFYNPIYFAATFGYFASAFSLLIVIAVYDLKHKIIPDMLALFFGAISFTGLFFFNQFGLFPHIPRWIEIFSGLFVAVPFAVIWLLSRGAWMGLGDAKLVLGLGFLLGLSRLLSGVVIAFWTGAALGLFLVIFSKNHSIKSEIPFAPFLVFGSLLAFLLELHIFPL